MAYLPANDRVCASSPAVVRPCDVVMRIVRHSLLQRCCAALLAAAGSAVASERQALSGAVVVGAGYDEGTLIVPELLALDSGVDGASAEARTQLGWLVLRNPGGRLDVVAHGSYRQVDGDALRDLQAGGGVNASGAVGPSVMTAKLDGERRWLNQAGLAWNAGLTLGAALPFAQQVALPEIELRSWRFDDLAGEDGVLVAIRYRHWLPLADGDPRRRVEVSVGGGRYQAERDLSTYNQARIDAGVRGRVGPDHGAGRWDFSAGGWYEFRDYCAGTRERHHTGVIASIDRWLTAQLALGIEAGWEGVTDQPGSAQRDQLQASLRATAAF